MKAVASARDSLIARCVAGEHRAWQELHEQYLPVAYAFLRRLGVRAPDADDACQEVFVQVFRYLSKFQHRADFKTWLYRLCLTQAGRIRRRALLSATIARLIHRPDRLSALSGPEWPDTEIQKRVAAALMRMKDIHRQIFVLFEFEGLSGREIAAVTGLAGPTIRRRLHNARREFRSLIENDRGDKVASR